MRKVTLRNTKGHLSVMMAILAQNATTITSFSFSPHAQHLLATAMTIAYRDFRRQSNTSLSTKSIPSLLECRVRSHLHHHHTVWDTIGDTAPDTVTDWEIVAIQTKNSRRAREKAELFHTK
ncbi:MAG: hypothetical protein K2H16_01595 [Prevotella sp.]|nr:hypothetical protein [Prevotella sp.]